MGTHGFWGSNPIIPFARAHGEGQSEMGLDRVLAGQGAVWPSHGHDLSHAPSLRASLPCLVRTQKADTGAADIQTDAEHRFWAPGKICAATHPPRHKGPPVPHFISSQLPGLMNPSPHPHPQTTGHWVKGVANLLSGKGKVFGCYFSEQAEILEIKSLSLAVSKLYFSAVNPSFWEQNLHMKCRHKRLSLGLGVGDKEYLFTPTERPKTIPWNPGVSWNIV